MLQTTIIGNVGGDARLNEKDGRKFTTFRVAHNDRWTDDAGQTHSNTLWVDCIMSDHPKVAEYLKAGTLVAVVGDVTLRVYSSPKDRCMKAGMTIRVRQVELLGGQADPVPTRLYDQNGVQHNVTKFYWTDVANTQLINTRGDVFTVDANGWVVSAVDAEVAAQTDTSNDGAVQHQSEEIQEQEPAKEKENGKRNS